MSKNKEIKFVKWHEENIKDEYRDEYTNWFLYDEWFDNLPKNLQDIIMKTDETSYGDDNYESLLEDLEVEIKEYVREYCNGNYDSDEGAYLLAYSRWCEAMYNECYDKEVGNDDI